MRYNINMDPFYDELFGDDDTDTIFRERIPTIDFKVFKKLLDDYLKIINRANASDPFDFSRWAQFKLRLLDYEKQWGNTIVFDWTMIPNKKGKLKPTIHVFYDVLENRTSRYFQVLMAFDDVWMGKEHVNFWSVIYEELGMEIDEEELEESQQKMHAFYESLEKKKPFF